MKMGKVEKLFVNSANHTKQVAQNAERLLSYANPQPQQRYLDLGCGNGAAPIYLAQKYNLLATGVDVDYEQIEAATAASVGVMNVRFLTLDGVELPFADQEFDIVSTFKVTHHIANWQDALAELARVLKPGGYFVYSDIVVPRWVASIGSALVKKRLGFPNVPALRAFIAQNSLAELHLKETPVLYEGVFRKEAA
jgi:SAM-dependent methyltransferase